MTEKKTVSEMIEKMKSGLEKIGTMANGGNYSGAIEEAKDTMEDLKNLKNEIEEMQISAKIQKDSGQETILGEID